MPCGLSKAAVVSVSEAELQNLYARRRHAHLDVGGGVVHASDLGALQHRRAPEFRPNFSRENMTSKVS